VASVLLGADILRAKGQIADGPVLWLPPHSAARCHLLRPRAWGRRHGRAQQDPL